MTQVIRLLSDPHANSAPENWEAVSRPANADLPTLPTSFPPSDPFSAVELTYSTTGTDSFPAPAAYPSRRFSWVHIFPEGMIHQHPDKVMRYFKWGVARLILEAEPCPDVLPMWIDGPQHVMDNDRPWPRPMPRAGKDISVVFGDLVDTDKVFGPFRERWRELKERVRRKRVKAIEGSPASVQHDEKHEAQWKDAPIGELHDDELKYSAEAEQLRIDVTLAVRNEVLKVRRSMGLPDEDPKRGLAETFRAEGGKEPVKGKPVRGKDGSVVMDW
jgi:monolysocardiolipin acyltransferase